MPDAVMAAIITGGLSLLGVLLSNHFAALRTEESIKTAQAVTDTKLEALTREVQKHNNFAGRVPILETEIDNLIERVRRIEEK